ncbi:response regulator [Paenibacillus glufosinatiresistens]|uniref:response regulator n=1 Tax=Paenibacillus glufosinatiresistens TaxID=3070657 RepID=UPI00286E4157|nr:response regulator [Paenibacillus sp. YX.27]
MYKLILVEDEEEVREGIASRIDWNAHGFEVVDQAENGREAAELIDRLQPDVVVTDIQMPFMNGLQLAEWIRSHHPGTKIIILTGYDEFEYAQRAIKLQIDEYLLKPFSAAELVEVLSKVRTAIEAEIAEKENIHLLSEHYRKSLPLLREQFLSSLVSRRLRLAEINEKCAEFGLSFAGNHFLSSVIRLDHIRGTAGDDPGGRLSLRDTGDRNLQLFAVLNVAEESCRKHQLGRVFIHRDDAVLLTHSVSGGGSDLLEATLEMLEEIRSNVQRYLRMTVTAGTGTVRTSPAQFYDSLDEAVQALDYRLLLGNNRVIWIEDVESRNERMPVFDELTEQAFIRTIKLGTVQELRGMLDELFGGFDDSRASAREYQIFLLEIVTSLMRVAKETGTETNELFGQGLLALADVRHFNNMAEARDWIAEVCMRLMDKIAQERQSSYRQLIDEAKEFIKAHYSESDMSVGRVCQHLHISTGYFSSIFKKETKTTFVAYLLHIRLEAAKELLRSTELKAFEIAERIGFSDPNYFSFCFRKKYGLSPKEYKNEARGG